MKIKILIPASLVLCLAFSLCACGTTASTTPATAPVTTTAAAEAVTTQPQTEAPTVAATEAAITENAAEEFTGEDAVAAVEAAYDFADDCYFEFRGVEEIDDTTYFAVDLKKDMDGYSTYLSSFFVTADGEITKGYYADGEAFLGTMEVNLDITEENATDAVNAAFDFEDGTYLKLRGTEEFDGVTYYAVDLMRSLDTNSTYLCTYFISTTGTIVEGYYAGGVAYLAE